MWKNYKDDFSQSQNSSTFHRQVPCFFMYDDVEILNDIRGAGSVGFRDRRAAFPIPEVIFQNFDGRTGRLKYAETIRAR